MVNVVNMVKSEVTSGDICAALVALFIFGFVIIVGQCFPSLPVINLSPIYYHFGYHLGCHFNLMNLNGITP